ncbi:MAG: CTP synthase [Nanoarchaeota archaeon]
MEREVRYIVVTGGVISGLGKGLFISSLGKLLQSKGYKVVPIKIDPYINVDAGTMNPIEHGEVFVLDDGSEVDMDLGNYERFMNLTLTNKSSITTGKIFQRVIEKERRGDYLGKTVQPIPHITGELQHLYKELARESEAEIVLIEIGGTVGDIENQLFLESVRELALENEVFFIHCALVPVMGSVGEQKTKPVQQSVRLLREMGIQPNMLFCRSEKPLEEYITKKIAAFCGVKPDYVISGPDVKNIYEIPLILDRQMTAEKVLAGMKLFPKQKDLRDWKKFVENMNNPKGEINIAIIGKYTQLKDSYASIIESFDHCEGNLGYKVNLKWIESSEMESSNADFNSVFNGINGILVPGGFGSRGIEGKIKCIKYARENNIPFLGLCLGMQLAVIEFARSVCGLTYAHTTEIKPESADPVIDIMNEQKEVKNLGGTMRLGKYPAVLKEGSLVKDLYRSSEIYERHRHRYEVNNNYIEILESKGIVFSGKSPNNKLMEFVELPDKLFFVATQAHPELKSRPLSPHPLFIGFAKAAIEHARTLNEKENKKNPLVLFESPQDTER